MSDDDKVKPIPVQFKAPPSEEAPVLEVVRFDRSSCNHQFYFDQNGRLRNVTYRIREGETEVECGHCKTRLNPMWVLTQMAGRESRWRHARQTYLDEMRRLAERSRTKCEHCGRMTRISRR